MTVEDPRLAALFRRAALYEGDPVGSAVGFGGPGTDRGVFVAPCPAGEAAFVVQATGSKASADLRALFPRYVEVEAARLGCGRLDLELSRPGHSG